MGTGSTGDLTNCKLLIAVFTRLYTHNVAYNQKFIKKSQTRGVPHITHAVSMIL